MDIDLHAILRELERERCTIHNEHPTITVLPDSQLKVSACCTKFSDRITDLVTEKSTEAVTKNITDMFNKAFGG